MSIKKRLKRHGLADTVRYAILKMLKIEKQQEEIDSLYYYLNSLTDIKQIPPTKDEDLRLMQLGILELMKIFDKLCKKHGLQYCIATGNLLGAVRHHGFIPWDDDADVYMLRSDYDKVIPLFKEVLAPYGIIVRWGGYFDNRGYLERLALAYKTLETGVWMDIFPIDSFRSSNSMEESNIKIRNAIKEYKRYYAKNEKRLDKDKMINKKNEIFERYGFGNEGENIFYVFAMEFLRKQVILEYEDLFPLRSLQFEDYMFPCPNAPDVFLRSMYGPDYMSFPRRGMEHHTNPDGLHAKLRARANHIDMNDVIRELRSISEKL